MKVNKTTETAGGSDGLLTMIATEPISFSCDGSFSVSFSACAWRSYVFFFFFHKAL